MRLQTYFEIGGIGSDAGGVHDGGKVDAGALAEKAPQLAGKKGQHRLTGQQQRYPLVVADLCGSFVQPTAGDRPLDGQVVSVADPAHGVRVVAVALRELRRTPAVDRRADELLGRNEEREADEDRDRVCKRLRHHRQTCSDMFGHVRLLPRFDEEDRDGVETTETVGVVVVGVRLQLAHADR